jgi:hypothetical protein
MRPAGTAAVSSYEVKGNGDLEVVTPALGDTQKAACWVGSCHTTGEYHKSQLIEKLGSKLDTIVVTSSKLAAAAPEPLERLGAYRLVSIAEPQEIFSLPISPVGR